ncbi:MAG: lipocalin family protein [bacterium]
MDHENYQYSLVCGPNKSYLWILARSSIMKKDTKYTLRESSGIGFRHQQTDICRSRKIA